MSTFRFKKPQLPSHYYVRSEPPDRSGDEQLHFSSERRKITLKGHGFREFQQRVIPLLDGQYSWETIQERVADVFSPEDLQRGLELLADNHLLRDADENGLPMQAKVSLEPQLNFWHEMNMNARDTQQRLAKATVSIIGLGGVGASAALALAAARIGTLRCFDPLSVSATDPYLCPSYSPDDLGTPRAEVVRRKIELLDPAAGIDARMDVLDSDETVVSAINGSDFVLCCVDPGAGNTIYKVNRACLQTGTSWTSCTVSGFEGVLGPTVHPRQTPCYLCYKMRAVSCAENPEDEFAFQRFLDRRRHEDSGRRENLVFGVGIIANLAGLEVMKALTEFHPPSSEGRIVVIDFLDVSCKKHLVLRKPWCPACGVAASNSVAR